MAVLRIPDENRELRDFEEIRERLSAIGIQYEIWSASRPVPANAPPDEVLEVYAGEIQRLKDQGGYVTADVIDVNRQTPGLEQMLAKFNLEHWHDDDEVRFIIHGRGVFHIRPERGPVVSIEAEAGDLIRVPEGTRHWFDLCSDREIRAIRLFKDPSGWAPRYTQSGAEKGYQPLCLGPSYIPAFTT
jgi:1,2-dihydroxy-3-keto-5-methylthiopentene dioxygenase